MKKTKKLIIRICTVLAIFLLLIGFFTIYFNWQKNYHNRINPGVYLGNLDLSQKTALELKKILQEKISTLTENGLTFNYNNKKIVIDLANKSFDPDLSYHLVNFNIEASVNEIVKKHGSHNFFNYLLTRLNAREKKPVAVIYSLEKERLQELLSVAFIELNIPPVNAFFSFENKSSSLMVNPEKIGKGINYELLFNELDDTLEVLQEKTITLKTHSKYPSVKSTDLAKLEEEAQKIIKTSGLRLFYKKPDSKTNSKLWLIKPEKLVTWLMIKNEVGELKLILDQEKIAAYLTEFISPSVNIEPIKARFEMKNNKVSTWQRGIDGQKINIASSSEKIMNSFFTGETEIDLIIEKVLSQELNPDDTYNIQEIIGTGHSNFTGSSLNRRKNIAIGAETLDGLLISPGEEFSLVAALGDVSAETGYYPELVIKDNKTIPEYGGGLCQIATTLFRAALASGLPITERRNHSYRVSYYEPAGMDAAVYIPHPDVRFINDLPNYILIQIRIENNDIYFDFWGKKDGRIASTTKPVIYNIVKPAPTKYIESEELKPGEKKCTESAHNGASTYFDYTVVYPEGATTTPVQERRFTSHYVPWQEVCLIGKEAVTESEETNPENKLEVPLSETVILLENENNLE